MLNRKIRFLGGFILILSLFSGCAAQRTVKPPELSVADMRFESMTLFETKAAFEVRIENENPFPLEIDGGVHRLYLNDVYLGKGFDKETFTVPRLGSVTRPIVVNVSNLSLLTKIHSLATKPELSYRIESELYRNKLGRSFSAEDAGTFFALPEERGSVRRYGPKAE